MLSGMSRLSNWDVIYRPGGWIRAKGADEDTTVYLRVRETDEGVPSRLNVHFAAMASEKPISAHVWRFVPFEHIEQHANEKNYRRALELDPDEFGGGPAQDDLDSYFVDDNGEAWQPAHTVKMREGVAAHGPSPRRKTTEPTPLEHPGRRISEEFLRNLAAMYLWLVGQGQPPAPEIAKQTGAPVGTVRRWIANARQREFLPPGRPGRAG
jgi:hypothetical protein